jgi:hypothetical protein
MPWIRTDFDFGFPYKTFTVSARQLALANRIRDEVIKNEEKPEELEKILKDIVEHIRPNLKGCVICAINLRMGMIWEFSVAHPNLPRVMAGKLPETEDLFTGPDGMILRDSTFFHTEPLEPQPHTVNLYSGDLPGYPEFWKGEVPDIYFETETKTIIKIDKKEEVKPDIEIGGEGG